MDTRIILKTISVALVASIGVCVDAGPIATSTHELTVSAEAWRAARDSGLDVLGKENSFSLLVIGTSLGGKNDLRIPAPFLDSVIPVEGGRYLVGLSASFDEPFNVVLWDARGKVLLATAITCTEIADHSSPACPLHSGDRFEWYDAKQPIESTSKLGSSRGTVSIRLRNGATFAINFEHRRAFDSSRARALGALAVQHLGTCAAPTNAVVNSNPIKAYAWCQQKGVREGVFVVTALQAGSEPVVIEEGVYRVGKKDGLWRTRAAWSGGMYMSSVKNFRDGAADGLSIEFWPDRKPLTIGAYEMDKPVGVHVTFDNSGSVVELAVFQNGEPLEGQDASSWGR